MMTFEEQIAHYDKLDAARREATDELMRFRHAMTGYVVGEVVRYVSNGTPYEAIIRAVQCGGAYPSAIEKKWAGVQLTVSRKKADGQWSEVQRKIYSSYDQIEQVEAVS